MDVVNEVKDLISKGEGEVFAKNTSLALFMRVYKEVFDEQICGNCKKNFPSYWLNLKNWYLKVKNTKMSTKYRLKEGYSGFMQVGSRTRVMNSVLTDEMAAEFLRINPNRIALFVKFPKNWQEEAGITPVKPKVNPAADVSLEEVVDGKGEVQTFAAVMGAPKKVTGKRAAKKKQ